MTAYLGYIAMSLDGRIADAGGGLDWLHAFGGGDAEDHDYAAFYAGIDALVMGRATYDFVAREAAWPYGGKPSYVVTTRPVEGARPEVIPVAPDYAALRARIEAAGHGRVWIVGGGLTQRGALDAGMLGSLRLFVMPVIVGGGPLVLGDGGLRQATLVGHRVWPKGVVELEYRF